jgi:hypothetical protein
VLAIHRERGAGIHRIILEAIHQRDRAAFHHLAGTVPGGLEPPR